MRVVRGEGRTDRRDGSEVGREGSGSPAGPEPGFQNPGLRVLGTEGKWNRERGVVDGKNRIVAAESGD